MEVAYGCTLKDLLVVAVTHTFIAAIDSLLTYHSPLPLPVGDNTAECTADPELLLCVQRHGGR